MDEDITSLKKNSTEHYTFHILKKRKFTRGMEYMNYFEVGDSAKPCLSLTVYTEQAGPLFGTELIKTAKLCNIEALYNCVLEEDAKTLFEMYSFSQELVRYVIKLIKTHYTHVYMLQLDDESYIPCNREQHDTLDLLTYSIAKYGMTWYERAYNAILSDKSMFQRYREEVHEYMSTEFKQSVPWDIFLFVHFGSATEYANQFMKQHLSAIKALYEDAPTFPVFFRTLSVMVGKKHTCQFFKSWLQQFIGSHIHIHRRWLIPLRAIGGKRHTNRTRNSKIDR